MRWLVMESCPQSCHNNSRCLANGLASRLSTSLPGFFRRLRAGPVNACGLTLRAAEVWESARFRAVFWLKLGSVKSTLSRPPHSADAAVGRTREKDVK